MNPLLTIGEALNRLAGTTGLTAQTAANRYAGTTGRTIQEALNVKAGVTGRTGQEAANILAGTTGLTKQEALNRLVYFGSFSPSSIAGLVIWVKADSMVFVDAGLTLATNGETVQQWSNQDPEGAHFEQGVELSRPLFVTNEQNGKPAVQFDGSGDFLGASIAADSSKTMFFAMKGLSATGTSQRFLSFGTGNTAGIYDQSGVWAYYANQASGAVGIGGTDTDSTIINLRLSSASALETILNGVSTGTFDPHDSISSATVFTLGAGTSAGLFPKDCDFFEVLIYDTVLSDANVNAVNTYLGTRWGISVSSL